ncbi:hypothetical protein Adt_20768 [Abeliophyllum distichum]|uniref:Uncharacterized protein n=1 Tax=Abeliophyllum distichum TaxID=126358 RepID=A0ABD1SXH7_9LAMI
MLLLPKEHRFAQEPLPLGLGHFAAYSSYLRSIASLKRPLSLELGHFAARSSYLKSIASLKGHLPLGLGQFTARSSCLRSIASLKCLSHWDSATLQHGPLA